MLSSPWERAVAVHEAGHLVAAHHLGFHVASAWITPLNSIAGARRGQADCLREGEGLPPDELARLRAVVCLAGTVAQALVCGSAYRWMERTEAVIEACSWRAAQKREPPSASDPADLKPHDWATPDHWDGEAVNLWLHQGRGGDVSLALNFIEESIATITDPLERSAARHDQWDTAQGHAVRLCREHVEEIRDLATLLCERGGVLTAAEVQAFFATRPGHRTREA